MSAIPKLKSIEDASVVRKFSVLFALMSFLPFIILSVLFFIFISTGSIKINLNLFFWAVFLTGVFAIIGFFSMRQTLVNLARLSRDAKSILEGDLSKGVSVKTKDDNEVAQLARVFNEAVQKLENNIKELEKSKKMVQEVLVKVASGASSSEDIDAFLDLILTVTVKALDGNIGLLLILDEDKKELIVKSAYGTSAPYAKNTQIPLGEEVAGWVVKQKKPLLIPRLHKISVPEDNPLPFAPPLICAPLVFKNKVVGVISINGKKQDIDFTEDELVILSNIASQVALAIENARLSSDNQKNYLETISALALAVEARDVYSRGHSDRVRDYAVKIAVQMGLSQQQIKTIKEAAQLHDVGKIGISDEILKKPNALNDFERNIMEQHPLIGEGIIIPLHGMAHLRDPLRHHHEWINGEGYPDHLKGNEICLEAKILGVADSFDAMTTDRPYRKKMDFNQAKEELLKYKDIRYDRKVVDALIGCL